MRKSCIGENKIKVARKRERDIEDEFHLHSEYFAVADSVSCCRSETNIFDCVTSIRMGNFVFIPLHTRLLECVCVLACWRVGALVS